MKIIKFYTMAILEHLMTRIKRILSVYGLLRIFNAGVLPTCEVWVSELAKLPHCGGQGGEELEEGGG